MRNFTFKGLFLTAVFALLWSLTIQAAEDGLITKQITIKLKEAGTLPDRIDASKKYLITNLKLVGEINGTDWKMIREMAGSNYNGYSTEGKLSTLDLSEAKIVKGGDSYYSGDNCYTSNDEIGEYAFHDCSGLTSLTLPAGITSISDCAFEGCSGLTSLTLPAGITSIGSRAFYWCSGLTSLTLPDGITSIGSGAFSDCSGLTSLILPAGITSISDCAFAYCSGLTSLTLPDGITSINYGTFSGCSGLTSLTLPAGITSIGSYAFYGCSGLTSINIPASVTKIEDSAFLLCSGLTSLTLPDGITSIGSCAFWSCSGLTSINIPASVTKIEYSAFRGCSGLTSLILPAGITSISNCAFSGCSGLTSIYVYAEKVPGIGSYAFEECDAKKCTVYVPKGTYGDYRSSDFGYFENIVEFDATGIDKTTTSTDVEEVSRYSVNGQRLVGPTKGLNIVKYSDGSVKKVAVE